jgi:hypothetical protein
VTKVVMRYTLATPVLIALMTTSSAGSDDAVIREERVVEVSGKAELWRLEWEHPPISICGPRGVEFITCPCQGFEFGEQGELDLIRLRSEREVDRLHLTALFETELGDGAALRRYPTVESDMGIEDVSEATERLWEAIRARAPVRALEVGDFNHDGWATEFVLQIGTLPCGRRLSVLVGVSPDRPALHPFASAEHPQRPLVLYFDHWQRLRTAKKSFRVVEWTCGDHGSEVQNDLVLSVDRKGVHATRETFSCVPGAEHGPLLSREIL